MEARQLLRTIPDAVRERVPTSLRDFQSGARFSLVQCWYGNRQIHYETWLRRRLGTVEVGLHFEADPLTNARLLGAFRGRERALRRRLPGARIEEWDRGWARIWEPIAVSKLDDALRDAAAARLADYVAALEPILREELPADAPWTLPRISARAPRGTTPRAR